MAAKTFTVIAGDLVSSRDSLGRQEASRKIPAAINLACTEFRSELYAPLVLTRGIDEVSGVLKRPNMAYRICRLVNDGVSPRLFRFAATDSYRNLAQAHVAA